MLDSGIVFPSGISKLPIELGYVKVTLTPAQIKNLFTTPVELIPAPGAGKIIVLKEVDSVVIFNSVPYATQNTYNIKTSTTTVTGNTGQLFTNVNSYRQLGIATQIPLFPNVNVNISCTSNPTAGDSNLDLYLTYQVITL